MELSLLPTAKYTAMSSGNLFDPPLYHAQFLLLRLHHCSIYHFFKQNGVIPQQRVGLLLENSHVVLETHYAAAALRVIALVLHRHFACILFLNSLLSVQNLNHRLQSPELAHICNDCKPTWLVAHTKFW